LACVALFCLIHTFSDLGLGALAPALKRVSRGDVPSAS